MAAACANQQPLTSPKDPQSPLSFNSDNTIDHVLSIYDRDGFRAFLFKSDTSYDEYVDFVQKILDGVHPDIYFLLKAKILQQSDCAITRIHGLLTEGESVRFVLCYLLSTFCLGHNDMISELINKICRQITDNIRASQVGCIVFKDFGLNLINLNKTLNPIGVYETGPMNWNIEDPDMDFFNKIARTFCKNAEDFLTSYATTFCYTYYNDEDEICGHGVSCCIEAQNTFGIIKCRRVCLFDSQVNEKYEGLGEIIQHLKEVGALEIFMYYTPLIPIPNKILSVPGILNTVPIYRDALNDQKEIRADPKKLVIKLKRHLNNDSEPIGYNKRNAKKSKGKKGKAGAKKSHKKFGGAPSLKYKKRKIKLSKRRSTRRA